MERSGWIGVGLGSAAAAVLLAPLVVGPTPREVGTEVTLPDRLAGYSYLTSEVSAAPPGRAVALWQHGFGVEFMDFPQAVVLAADDDVYRRLDRAEERAGGETQGDPGPMLLSPDGRQVALGDHDMADADLEVVDLATGDVVRRTLPAARSVRPVAWSRDGRRVAYLADDGPTNPHLGQPLVGALWVLDLDTGVAGTVPGSGASTAAAFSPDGARLAVQEAGGVAIVDLASEGVRALPGGGVLAGPEAWSPDGRLLAVGHGSSIELVDVDGRGAATSARVDTTQVAPAVVLGWTGDREVVLPVVSEDTVLLVAQPVSGGRAESSAASRAPRLRRGPTPARVRPAARARGRAPGDPDCRAAPRGPAHHAGTPARARGRAVLGRRIVGGRDLGRGARDLSGCRHARRADRLHPAEGRAAPDPRGRLPDGGRPGRGTGRSAWSTPPPTAACARSRTRPCSGPPSPGTARS